jgi:hypothetical protein
MESATKPKGVGLNIAETFRHHGRRVVRLRSSVNPLDAADRIDSEVAALAPWIFQFRIGARIYGGSLDPSNDGRITQFFNFAPRAQSILELGALEGAHTFRLVNASGVQRVVAIEGRITNLRKAELIQRLLGISGVEFVCGDLEEIDLQRLGHFDAVFASGILYHLAKPWLLLRRLTTVAPKLYLWTHYCPASATNTLLDGYYGCLYPEGGVEDPLSGLSATSFWFTRASLFDALSDAGYSKIELVDEDTHHPKGPTITLSAE